MIKGRVHSFQSLGTVDGPGIRCVVFMQGCPLRCLCCQNPETQDFEGGEEYSPEELFEKVYKYHSYFGEKGGVTVSGGEPLAQAEFLHDFFSICRQYKIHTTIDTSGCLFDEKVEELLSVTDLVLLDHKFATEEGYEKGCGGSLLTTETFLAELDKRNIDTWIRRVIIPGYNDDEESMKQLSELVKRYGCIKKTELLPFRKLCIEKYEELGRPFLLKDVPEPLTADMEKLRNMLE